MFKRFPRLKLLCTFLYEVHLTLIGVNWIKEVMIICYKKVGSLLTRIIKEKVSIFVKELAKNGVISISGT